MPKRAEFNVVVPVRAGSTRVQGKNLRHFTDANGYQDSLLSWKLRQLLTVFHPDQVLLTSDWALALQLGREFGVRTHRRSDKLCTEDAPFEEVILDSAKLVESTHMIWAPVTAPFFGPHEINSCLEKYMELGSSAFENGLIAVERRPSYFFLDGTPVNFPIGKGHVRTQDLTPLFELNWTFCVRDVSHILRNSYMFSDRPELFEVDRLSNTDINDQLDFVAAQSLVNLYLENKREGSK